MRINPPNCVLFLVFLAICMVSAGCSDEQPAGDTPAAAPTLPGPKYSEGDIVATPTTASASALYLIIRYDAGTDQYTRAIIEKNADGTWGHRSSERTEKVSRVSLERTYTVKAGHVVISLVPVITLAAVTETTEAGSGRPPSVSRVSPGSAARDTTVSMTISGAEFQDGATVRLFRAGAVPVDATVNSVTAFEIACVFNLHGRSDGSYNLIVTNPDGQSDTLTGAFTIGETAPIIGSLYPVSGAMGESLPLTINGQNFRTEVKVSFLKNSTEMVCDSPLSMESSKILCTLDLSGNRGASPGEWAVTVINIRDGTRGTWVKTFTVTNATAAND